MIKNVFLPEKVGNYYLFKQRIIGIDIGKTHIIATPILLRGNTITIEPALEEKIENNKATAAEDRMVTALKNVMSRAGRYDAIRTALSSSIIVFKELKIPFATYQKIKLVINFEVEPLLPFSINDAVIDFIITKQIPEEKSSQILVAAIQKENLDHHLQLFDAAGIAPEKITIDLFALFGLYHQIPSYHQLSGIVILLDLGIQTTRLGYLQDGQLRFIRTLPQGLSHVAKQLAEMLHINQGQALEQMIRFGLEKSDSPEYVKAVTNALTDFFNKIQFTIASFTMQTAQPSVSQPAAKVLLLGNGADMNGLVTFATNTLQTPCQLFNGNLITENQAFQIKTMQTITTSSLISLSTALPSPFTEKFNLQSSEFKLMDTTLLLKQLITAASLTLLLLVMLFTQSFVQIRRLDKELRGSTQEALTALKERFKAIDENNNDLEEVIASAREELNKEEQTWFAFSSQARAKFLQYLLELTNRIDQKETGFVPEQITISEGMIILKAQVRDYEALIKLEKELRQSKLFSEVEGQNDPNFTMKIKLARILGK